LVRICTRVPFPRFRILPRGQESFAAHSATLPAPIFQCIRFSYILSGILNWNFGESFAMPP
jgi:hypothetical protein